MQNELQPRGVRIPAAAIYLGVAQRTVWLYIEQGKIKAVKLSPKVTVILKEELDRFLDGIK